MTHWGRQNVLIRWRRWKLRTFTDYGSGHAAVYRVRGGRRFVAHPGDALSGYISDRSCCDPLESQAIECVLKPGDVAVDVGANIGWFTALCSSCVGPEGRVLALEPGPATFAKLQQTIELLGLRNVEASAIALADRPGFQSLIVSTSGADAYQSLVDWDGFPGSKIAAKVEVLTLDDFLDQSQLLGRTPAFVKCDVEGAEAKILAGGSRLLQSASPPLLMVEINRKALAAQRSGANELLAMLREYRTYFTPLDSGATIMQALKSADQLPEIANVLAFPERGVYAARIMAAARFLSDGGD
jgi:FkbM family methyltransferase